MDKIKKLPLRDFTRYCMSIAAVPTSYLAGLSLEEQMLWLCSFLTDEVIPAVNNNGGAVEELQALYVELKNYVDNYFDNLDIQEEVNTKLEDMAQSGELAELISQYLESQAIIGFNNNETLSLAQNLANGSFARTYGKVTYNDGKGAFYKIRTRTNADVPDGDTLIALTNTENLVAEIIPYSRGYDIQTGLQAQINNINSQLEEQIICIGDSYGAGAVPGGTIDSWVDYFKSYIGYDNTNFYSNCLGGTGFYANADGKTFQTLLEELENTVTDPNKIKRIYVLGGYNDQVYSISQMNGAISSFMTYAKTTYPNAKVYVGCVGYDSRITQSGTREALYTKAIPCYKRVIEYGGVYLYDIEYILHNPNYLSGDNIHPNEDGQTQLGRYLVSNVYGTQYNPTYLLLTSGKIDATRYQLSISDITDSYVEIGKLVNNNVTTIGIKMELNLDNATTISASAYTLSNLQTILNERVNQAQFCTGSLNKVVKCRVVSNANFVDAQGILEFNGTNLTIRFYQSLSSVTAILIPYQEFELPSILC